MSLTEIHATHNAQTVVSRVRPPARSVEPAEVRRCSGGPANMGALVCALTVVGSFQSYVPGLAGGSVSAGAKSRTAPTGRRSSTPERRLRPSGAVHAQVRASQQPWTVSQHNRSAFTSAAYNGLALSSGPDAVSQITFVGSSSKSAGCPATRVTEADLLPRLGRRPARVS